MIAPITLVRIRDDRGDLIADIDTDDVGTSVFISDGWHRVRIDPILLDELIDALTRARQLLTEVTA